MQTDLSRALARRSALVPPSTHLVVEFSEGDAAPAAADLALRGIPGGAPASAVDVA